MSDKTSDVIVVGAGIIGCATAYYLAKKGVSVTVLEADEVIGNGGSTRNGGGVRQSGRDPRELPLAMYAVKNLWPTLSEELDADVEYCQGGNLRLGKTERHLEILRGLRDKAVALGLDMRMIDGDEVRAINPYLSEEVIGASWCPTDGHANPLKATYAYCTAARRLGAPSLRREPSGQRRQGVDERRLGAGLYRRAELNRERPLPDLRRHDQGEHDAPVLLAQELLCAPAVAILFVTISICLITYFSGDSSDAISFLILVVTVLWLVSYIFADTDVLVLRRRFPKAPRAFKVPGGPVIPVIGIAGTVFMIANISSDPAEAVAIWILAAVIFLALNVYSFFWIKYKMRMPVFKPVPIPEVLAMENDLYYEIRHRHGIWR